MSERARSRSRQTRRARPRSRQDRQRSQDRRARSRSRQDRQRSRQYQCAVCKRRMPAGVWQVWEPVVVPAGRILLYNPVYRDRDGQIWATRCERCRWGQAI